MNEIQKIIMRLDEIPEDAKDYGEEYIVSYGKLCTDAKFVIQYLEKYIQKLQTENIKLKNGTKLLLTGIKELKHKLDL